MKTISKKLLSESFELEQERNSMVLLSQVNLLNKIRNSKDTGTSKLYSTWLINKEILSKQYSLPVDQRLFDTDSLENVCERLEKKVSAQENSQNIINHSSGNSGPLSKKQSGSANIEFVRFRYKISDDQDSTLYAAFIIKNSDSLPAFVKLCSEKRLMDIMKNKNGSWIDEDELTKKIYSSHNKNAAGLYKMIWEPIEPYLKNTRDINYSTSGLLNNIAFHAIYNGKSYLAQKYTFHRFFNMADQKNQGSFYQKPGAISIWDNIDYNTAIYASSTFPKHKTTTTGSFSILSQSITTPSQAKNVSKTALPAINTTEIFNLRKIFSIHHISISSYQGGYATEENFKKLSSTIKGILHISTHGFYTPFDKEKSKELLPYSFISAAVNPLFRCGLAFSGVNYYWLNGITKENHEDGILTGYEVAQLDLHNVQLVTLSACETGLGDVTDNEGNLGLQRAFKLAGVNNMLVSLWQVPAKQTRELLSLFYTGWLNGKTLSEALRNAESGMLKKGYPPYYWAGFVLIE